MDIEDALSAVWPDWGNPIAPYVVGGISRSPEEAMKELENSAPDKARIVKRLLDQP